VFTGSTNQVSGYSFHFDLFNRRDPRDPRYRSDWLALTRGRGVQLASARTELAGAIDADTGMHQWVKNTQTHLTQVMSQPGVTDQQIESAVTSLVDDLIMSMANRFQKNVNLQMLASRAADTTNEFASERIGIIQRALKSPTLAVEYLVTRQAPATAVPSTTATATAGGPVMNLPDLGTLRLIAAVGVGNGGNLTLNASMTNFNNTFRSNRIRDYRIGAQFDAPVTDIKNWGKVSFSLSALFLNLRQQPLGEDITVNNIPINSTGKIGYAQAKIEFPFGTSGIRLPLALTYASRQELLVNEKNKFGANIGLTFDLDKLVAGKSSAAPSK
jgi:hypothetical protein